MVDQLKKLSLSDLRTTYRAHLETCDLSPLTVQTSCSDAFVIWRRMDADVFWNVITSKSFEADAFDTLNRILPKQDNGQPNKNMNGYLAHLRRFRRFIYGTPVPVTAPKIAKQRKSRMPKVLLPKPTIAEVQKYLGKWSEQENYHMQEDALDKLFFDLCPNNTCIEDILLKVSTLNDFYSTNIFSTFPVAQHILQLQIDQRLKAGDPTLVDDIKAVGDRNHYSFATKYCSHHNPLEYPIYDSYVEKVLKHFRDVDAFASFEMWELKQYPRFKEIVLQFRTFYSLTHYTLKEIDQYIWQLGKAYYNPYQKKQ